MTYDAQRFCEEGFGLRAAGLDLANSEQWDGFGRRTDHLADPSWLAAFVERWGWSDFAAVEAPPFSQIAETRGLCRGLVEALATAGAPSAKDRSKLGGLLAAPGWRRLATGGGVELVPVTAGWSWILAEVAASMAGLLAEGARRRVKVCPNAGCRWAFYDETRGNTRRWCNDRACGNRDKVRRFRARRAAGEVTGDG